MPKSPICNSFKLDKKLKHGLALDRMPRANRNEGRFTGFTSFPPSARRRLKDGISPLPWRLKSPIPLARVGGIVSLSLVA